MTERSLRRRELLFGLTATALAGTPAAARRSQGAVFTVTASHSPNVVEEGGESVVTGTITNTGDEEAIQIVELVVSRDGAVTERRSTTVQLAPGESESRTERIAYAEYPGPGEYVGEVCTDNDCATATWTVAEPGGDDPTPASFDVEITGQTTPTAGEALDVTVAVSNTGEQSGEQAVGCAVDEVGSDSTTVALDGGAETTVTLSIPTSPGDDGTYTATASSEDDTDSATVSVDPRPAVATVEIVDTSTPTVGEALEATVAVENIGDVSTDHQVTLDVEDLGTATESVSLGGGEQQSLSLSIPTAEGDDGRYTATVSSGDDSDSREVRVRPRGPSVAVELAELTDPVAGEPIEATIDVENTGDEPAEQPITLDAGELGATTTTVSLAGGAATTVTLSVPTDAGDAGEYALSAASADDTVSSTVTVESRPATLTVSIDEVVEPTAGDAIEVTATVTNTGGVSATREIGLEIDGVGSASQTVSLSGGEDEQVSLSVPTDAGAAGAYTARVASADDSASQQVQVQPQPAFVAVDLTEPSSPTVGDPIEATVTVENTGGRPATQDLVFAVDGLGESVQTVTLDAGDSRTVSLSVPTESGDDGEYSASVTSENDSDSTQVTVTAPTDTAGDAETDGGATADDDGPGMGVGGALGGLGAVALYLRQRLRPDDTG